MDEVLGFLKNMGLLLGFMILYKLSVYLFTPIFRNLYDCIKGVNGFAKAEIKLERRIIEEYNRLMCMSLLELVAEPEKENDIVINDRRGKLRLQKKKNESGQYLILVQGYLRYFNERQSQHYISNRAFLKSADESIIRLEKCKGDIVLHYEEE